jgi:hypothetical protein
VNARVPLVLALVLAAIVGVVYLIQHRTPPTARPDAAVAATFQDASQASPCERLPGSFKLPAGVEVGEARASAGQLFVPVTFAKGNDRNAAVLLFAGDTSPPAELLLGPSFGDDPPPRVLAEGARVLAAHVTHEAKERAVRISRKNGAGWETIGTVPWPSSSLSFDVAFRGDSGVFVYSDEKPGASFVRVVEVPSGKVLASIPTAQPDELELARTDDGYRLFWTAGASEEAPDASDPNEGPGEGRSFRWIETARLDGHGVPLAAAQSVTDKRGHAVSLSVVASGALFFRDDFEPHEGEGTRLFRLERGDGAKPALVVSGTSRQAFDVVTGPRDATTLAYTAVDGTSRIVREGHEEIEPLLDDARLLGVVAESTWVAVRAQDHGRAAAQADAFFLRCRPSPRAQ